MGTVWKVIMTIFLVYIIVVDANRARRRRQTGLNTQSGNQNAPSNTFNSQTDARQQPLLPNPAILNLQGQPQSQQQQQHQALGQGGVGMSKDANLGQNQAGRQFSPYQNQYGSQGSNYYPYAGGGASGQYSSGQYGQYGQGMGQQYGQGMGQQYGQGMGQQYGQGMGQYGSYYQNQYPGSNSFYSGYNSGSNYNRPGYSSNYPSSGSNYGGYMWNAGQKQNVNMFTVFLSSLLVSTVCMITI